LAETAAKLKLKLNKRLVNIRKSKNISLAVKIRLYESLVILTLLYGAESWPLSVTQMKKIEAAHHKFQRRLLGITWRDKVRNEDIRKKTGWRKLEDIIKDRRLRWLGHILRMDNSRMTRQATHWELRGYKRKPWTTKEKLSRCHQARPQRDGLDLGRSQGTGEWQSRMVSTCGPMLKVVLDFVILIPV